jgi:hypothetical protein
MKPYALIHAVMLAAAAEAAAAAVMKCSYSLLSIYILVWEPPTMQNRQLPPCSKSRRHLYPTDY